MRGGHSTLIRGRLHRRRPHRLRLLLLRLGGDLLAGSPPDVLLRRQALQGRGQDLVAAQDIKGLEER